VIRILRKIAADEARHAELSWQFIKWAVTVGGSPVETSVKAALNQAIADIDGMIVRDYGVDLDAWHANGRLSCAEARVLSKRGIREIIVPCIDALFGRASSAQESVSA
jgi:hypothetical protein